MASLLPNVLSDLDEFYFYFIQVYLSGVLIDFISVPVTVGFTSATSVIIAVSQLKGLLGLQFKSSGFLDTLKQVRNTNYVFILAFRPTSLVETFVV